MRLEKFRIKNFRSIIDSGEIENEDIMVLVGPNQAGKSSILKGLNSISFSHVYDVENDLTQLNNINKKYVDHDFDSHDLPIVEATFSLSDKDRAVLKEKLFETEEEKIDDNTADAEAVSDEATEANPEVELTPENIRSTSTSIDQSVIDSLKEIKVTKYIDESYSVKLDEQTFEFENPYLIVKQCGDLLSELKNETKDEFNAKPNLDYKNQFESAIKSVKKLLPDNSYQISNKSKLYSPINELANHPVSESLKTTVQETASEIEERVEHYPIFETLKIVSFLIELMPRTVYFKDYDRLVDSITIKELKTNPKKHNAFLNLLKVADVRLDSLEDLEGNQSAIQQYLKTASASATKKLRQAYKQESFDLDIRYDNGTLLVFTTDPTQPGILLPPSYGSEGFQWFLGFYINFAVATKTEYKNAILLLDDPGVLLHPSGHKDLLRRFNSYLDDDVRTIYTTHLPSLISKASIDSIRVIYREDGQTHVVKNFWKLSNLDAWAPIRSSLGIDLTDSLFFGTHTIMVEGPSDATYFQDLMRILRENNRNVSLGFVLPIGGMGNVDFFIKLFDSQGLPYVAVLDASSGKLESEGRIIRINPINKVRADQTEFDIEDMIENEVLSKAFSNLYPELDRKTVEDRLSSSNSKAINILKGILVENGLNKNNLDKVKLAKHVVRVIKKNPKQYEKTLQNFEDLFIGIGQKFNDK